MSASQKSLIIGYGIVQDEGGRLLLLRRRAGEALWPSQWWLPGAETPLTEEPDDTVPRLFARLLRQQVDAVYAHTVFSPEPASGRHTVHNGYLVTVQQHLDGAPEDEANPFDAMEWWEPAAALAALPEPQAELLATVLQRQADGWSFATDDDADFLFSETAPPLSPLPNRTHAERRTSGAALLAEVTGNPQFAETIEARMGPFGSYLIDHLWGDIWQDGQLSRRQRTLAAMSAAAALMQWDAFAFNAAIGEHTGVTREEIVEICLQLTVECGFPNGNLALTRMLREWAESGDPYPPEPAAGKDDTQRRAAAASISEALSGRPVDPAALAADAQQQLGSVGRLTVDWAWGDIRPRPNLPPADRALCILAMHTALGRERELEGDLQAAQRLGCTWDQLDGTLAVTSAFCGLPRASDAARILQRLRTS